MAALEKNIREHKVPGQDNNAASPIPPDIAEALENS
jgi:hypothetical protein